MQADRWIDVKAKAVADGKPSWEMKAIEDQHKIQLDELQLRKGDAANNIISS